MKLKGQEEVSCAPLTGGLFLTLRNTGFGVGKTWVTRKIMELYKNSREKTDFISVRRGRVRNSLVKVDANWEVLHEPQG